MSKNKRFVYSSTIDSSLYGFGRKNLLPTSPSETKKGKIGAFDVSVKRGEYLNKYGNPIYSVYVFDVKTGKNGFCKSTSCSDAIETAIKKTGCDIRR
jgi:hypothetical protein